MFRYLRNINPAYSLKARLALAIGGSALILSSILSVIIGNISRTQIEADIEAALAELAYQMNNQLYYGIFEYYQDLQTISALSSIRDPDVSPAVKRSRLERFQQLDATYAWIGLTDTAGVIQVGTGGLREGRDLSSQPWFVQARRGPYLSNIPEAWTESLPTPEQPSSSLLRIALPVVDNDGFFHGVLVGHLYWDWAYEVQDLMLEPLKARYDVQMFVVAKDGTPLLSPPAPQIEILDLADLPSVHAGENRYYTATWPDGQAYLTAFAHSRSFTEYPHLSWTVLIRRELNEAFVPAWELQRTILAWGGGLGLLFAALGWVIAGRIAHPILTMSEAADQIRRGDYNVKIPVFQQRDEIGLLSTVLNKMVDTLNTQRQTLLTLTDQLRLDIAERERVEAALRESEERLERRVRDRTAELESANKQLESFSYSVSHDLRAPLRAVHGFSRIVRERYGADLPGEAQRYLELIQQGADQMDQLIEALLTFSRLGSKPLRKQRIQPAELVHQVLKELPEDLKREPLQLTVGDLPGCQADPKLLKQVFANLLSNALKYSSRRDVIRIEVGSRKIEGRWVYYVKDNGVGFEMQNAADIFGVFRRLHLAEEYEGAGIGLAIVEQIIRRHGGQVWAEAALDQGATFYFTL